MGSTENIKKFVRDVTKRAYNKIDVKLENKSLELSDKIDEADVFAHWKNESNIEQTSGYVVELTETGFNLATSTSEIDNYTSLSSNGAKYSSGFKNIYNRAFKFNGVESMLSDASDGTYIIGSFLDGSLNNIDVKVSKTETTYTYLVVDNSHGKTQEFNGNSWLIPKGDFIEFKFRGTSKITVDAVSVVVYEPIMSDMIESFCEESLYEQMLNKGYTGRESQFISRLYNLIKTEEGEWEPKLKLWYKIDDGTLNNNNITLTKDVSYDYNKATYSIDGTRVSLNCDIRFNKPELALESGKTTKIHSAEIIGLPFVCKYKKGVSFYLEAGLSEDIGVNGTIDDNKVRISTNSNQKFDIIGDTVEGITERIYLSLNIEYRIE